jgi:hypothetical protein
LQSLPILDCDCRSSIAIADGGFGAPNRDHHSNREASIVKSSTSIDNRQFQSPIVDQQIGSRQSESRIQ